MTTDSGGSSVGEILLAGKEQRRKTTMANMTHVSLGAPLTLPPAATPDSPRSSVTTGVNGPGSATAVGSGPTASPKSPGAAAVPELPAVPGAAAAAVKRANSIMGSRSTTAASAPAAPSGAGGGEASPAADGPASPPKINYPTSGFPADIVSAIKAQPKDKPTVEPGSGAKAAVGYLGTLSEMPPAQRLQVRGVREGGVGGGLDADGALGGGGGGVSRGWDSACAAPGFWWGSCSGGGCWCWSAGVGHIPVPCLPSPASQHASNARTSRMHLRLQALLKATAQAEFKLWETESALEKALNRSNAEWASRRRWQVGVGMHRPSVWEER